MSKPTDNLREINEIGCGNVVNLLVAYDIVAM